MFTFYTLPDPRVLNSFECHKTPSMQNNHGISTVPLLLSDVFMLILLRIYCVHPLLRGKIPLPLKSGVLHMTWNYIWWWSSSSSALEMCNAPSLSVLPGPLSSWSVSIHLDLLKNYEYEIKIFKTIVLL